MFKKFHNGFINFLTKKANKYPRIWKWWSRYPASIGAGIGYLPQFFIGERTAFTFWFYAYGIFAFSFETIHLYHERRVRAIGTQISQKIETEVLLITALINAEKDQ